MIVDEINIKIIVLGQGGVGKTSIVNSFLKKGVPERYIPTIGNAISRKDFILEKKKMRIRINIWDTGGQRSFNPLNPTIYSDIDASFLVFDLTKPKDTLLELKENYLEDLLKNAKESFIFLVGNKLDLISDKTQLTKTIKDNFIEGIPSILTSAKTTENVNDAFILLIYKYLESLAERFNEQKFKGIAGEYLKLVDKKKNELESLLINPENIDSFTLEKHAIPKISKKTLKDTESEDSSLKEYVKIREQMKKIEIIKEEIIENFNTNLSKIEKLINKLKSTPINLLIETINKTRDQMEDIKNDFKLNLDSLLNLEKSEK